jgi:hypothetical protein
MTRQCRRSREASGRALLLEITNSPMCAHDTWTLGHVRGGTDEHRTRAKIHAAEPGAGHRVELEGLTLSLLASKALYLIRTRPRGRPTYRNLLLRLDRPALGRGRIQRAIRRCFWDGRDQIRDHDLRVVPPLGPVP